MNRPEAAPDFRLAVRILRWSLLLPLLVAACWSGNRAAYHLWLSDGPVVDNPQQHLDWAYLYCGTTLGLLVVAVLLLVVNAWSERKRRIALFGLPLVIVVAGIGGCHTAAPLTNAYAGWAQEVGDRCAEVDATGACVVYGVSLVELIAVPEKFHGNTVRLIGYVSLQFEGNRICLSEETRAGRDCLHLDVDGLEDPGFRQGWALVQGTFDGELRGHLGCCSGTIDSIQRLEPWR